MLVRRDQWPFVIALVVLGPALGFTLGLYGDQLLCSDGCPMETSRQAEKDSSTSSTNRVPAPDEREETSREERPDGRDETDPDKDEANVRLPDGTTVEFDGVAPDHPVAFVVMKGTWCPVCRKQLKRLSNRIHEIRRQGGVVFGLSDASPARNRELMEQLDLKFPVLSDADHDFLASLGLWTNKAGDCHVTPGVVFLDREGEIARLHRGRYPDRPQEAFIIETLADIGG